MKKTKKAYTIIEIIFAIVIIGIAFSAIPTLLFVSTEQTQQVMDSRGFFHGLAKMKIVTNKPWDENNVEDFEKANIYYILDTAENSYDCTINSGRLRAGQKEGQYRRMCYTDKNASTSLGQDGGDFDDVDDFHNLLTETVEDFNLSTTVQYVATPSSYGAYDTNDSKFSTTTTNTKRVKVQITNGPAFYYFSVNIGTPRPFIKENQ